jgi:hypothetical protein
MTELKTAEEWLTKDGLYPWSDRLVANAWFIRQIQANALRWARDGLTGYGLTDAGTLQRMINQLETDDPA